MQDEEHEKTSEALTPRKRRRLIRLVVILLMVWLVAAYFLLPIAWRLATRHHPAVEGMPRITLTANGIKGDPLNIALVGTEEEVDAAMLAAGWLPADSITLRSSLRIAAGTLLRRSLAYRRKGAGGFVGSRSQREPRSRRTARLSRSHAPNRRKAVVCDLRRGHDNG